MGKFIQIHTLTGYSGVLLNRDDSGMAKRIEYGDGVRTRTSSQFAKRKLRTAEGPASLSTIGGNSVRSRLTFRRKIAEPLIADGLDEQSVIDVSERLMDVVYPPSAKAKTKRKETLAAIKNGEKNPLDVLERDELIILGELEIDFLKATITEMIQTAEENTDWDEYMEKVFADKEFKKNLRAMKNTTLDMAAFGRMVTGDSLSNMDAAVHVAHALTVHTQQSEIDFFTAVDDLKAEGEDHGAGHMGEVEINSPLLYGYYVIDFDQLVANLSGMDNAEEVSADMVGNIIELVTTQIVGAKKGSTAPYSTADFLMVEVGDDAPRTLAEAYRRPVRPTLNAAVEALGQYVEAKDKMYGANGDRYVMSAVDADISGVTPTSLPTIKAAVSASLKGQEA